MILPGRKPPLKTIPSAPLGLRLPAAPRAILKGSTLKDLLDHEAIVCLAQNLSLVHPTLDVEAFQRAAGTDLEPLGILDRGKHLARVLREHLPGRYEDAIAVLMGSLTPPLARTGDLGLAVFFYLPHVSFVAAYGLDAAGNGGPVRVDPAFQRGVFDAPLPGALARTHAGAPARMDPGCRPPRSASVLRRLAPAPAVGDAPPGLHQGSPAGAAHPGSVGAE